MTCSRTYLSRSRRQSVTTSSRVASAGALLAGRLTGVPPSRRRRTPWRRASSSAIRAASMRRPSVP